MGGEGSQETPRQRPRESGRAREQLREQVDISTPRQAERRIRELIAQRQREITDGETNNRRLANNYVYAYFFIPALQRYLNNQNIVPPSTEPHDKRNAYYRDIIIGLTGRLQNGYFEAPAGEGLPGISQIFTERDIDTALRETFDLNGSPGTYSEWEPRYRMQAAQNQAITRREQAWLRANPNAPPQDNPFAMRREAQRYAGIPPPARSAERGPRPSVLSPGETLERQLSDVLLIDPGEKGEFIPKLGEIVRAEWNVSADWDQDVKLQIQRVVDFLPQSAYYMGLARNWTRRETGAYVRMRIRDLQDQASSQNPIQELLRGIENARANAPQAHPGPNGWLRNGIDSDKAESLRHVLSEFRETFVDEFVDDVDNDQNSAFADFVLPEYEALIANMLASSSAEAGRGVHLDWAITHYCLNQEGRCSTITIDQNMTEQMQRSGERERRRVANTVQEQLRSARRDIERRRDHDIEEMKDDERETGGADVAARITRKERDIRVRADREIQATGQRIRQNTSEDSAERLRRRRETIVENNRIFYEAVGQPRGRLALYYYDYMVNLYKDTLHGEDRRNFLRETTNRKAEMVVSLATRLSVIRFAGNGWVQGWDQ